MPSSITLSIAGFCLKLTSEAVVSLEEGYLPFVVSDDGVADVVINCIQEIPAIPFPLDDLVFEAKNDSQNFYSIYRTDTGLGFIMFNQQIPDEILQVATLDKAFSSWTVFVNPEPDGSLLPLKYPFGPIVMYYLTVNSEALMIHASGIFDGEKGRIFTGFSGNGKSTISMLWANAGNQVINDDRLIVRKTGDGYFLYNTPMYYSDRPKKAPLDAIHLISHSPVNKINKQNGALAVSKVMAFCIQNNYDKEYIHNLLNFLGELCTCVPVFELGFVPDSSIVNFVKSNEH
jgi:hypothetical protein